MLSGSIQSLTADELTAPYLGRVTVFGIDTRFKPKESSIEWIKSPKQVVLSDRVAAKLAVKPGERVKIGVERFSDMPRSASLAKRSSSDVIATEEFTVAAILRQDSQLNDFNLTPNPETPLNVFVPIPTLSRMVSGDAAPKATTLFSSTADINELNAALRARLKPEDYGLKFREIDRRGYLSVESMDLILSPTTVDAIQAAAKQLHLHSEPTIIYVADSLSYGDKEIPYPIIAGLNPSAAEPLGPFLPPGLSTLADGEIVLVKWDDSPLNGLPDRSKLQIRYYDPEVEGEGSLKTAELTLRAPAAPIGNIGAALDRDLTPEIRGVTDARADLYNWDRPPVLPKEKIKIRVPEKHPRAVFYNKFKATPMAYVNFDTAKTLFSSRYGAVTSVRIAPEKNESVEQLTERLVPVLLKHLDPKSAGLVFDPIRDRLLTASKGGTDFGGLFLGFSCFLIAAALMLVGLLFRLTLDRRAKEVGLLLASGFSVHHVRSLLLFEGLGLAVLGALLGLVLGVGYNRLLLTVLLELWPDKQVANILEPHATTMSFVYGFGITVLMSLIALWLSIRSLVKIPPPALLRGETQVAAIEHKPGAPIAKWLVIACTPLGIALVVAGKFVSNPDMQAMAFFGGGALLLVAGLAALRLWMKRTRHAVVNGRGMPALAQLGSRNAARNTARSLLTAALLASAAFLLVAVESFRRQPGTEFLDKNGGSGGFNLIAEVDVPVFQSFDSGPGRNDLESRLQVAFGSSEDPRYKAAIAELQDIEVFPLRLRDGDDASCMNLYQAARPRVLGVTESLIQRGGFKFYATEASTTERQVNPWLLIKGQATKGPAPIPVFCEQNTAQWMLKKSIGEEFTMPGDDGKDVTLRLVGTLSDSPFQSELLMSDESFGQAFPNTGGYRVFLIRTPPGKEDAVGRVLSIAFRANGLIATPTRERVAAYQAVIGAYLSTFQLLGGLGLLLGVLGLAVVVLRGVWERVGELALLRAVGYRTRQLQFLVLAENALLLFAGLAIGVLAALISVAPHIAEGAAVPWTRLAIILGLVLVLGLGVASAATAGILRVPVIPALRRE
jgi:ABC-type antimicrobial peptide transport system permease subunit